MPGEDLREAGVAVESAVRLLRRLIPFPSAIEPVEPLGILSAPGRTTLVPEGPPVGPTASDAGSQAAALISAAASILDEEMAKGVLAAHHVNPASTARSETWDPGNQWMRQLHALIDQAAAVWSQTAAARADADPAPLPELAPAAAVRSGERATVSLVLCNKEDHAVRLTPMATDLLSSAGGRISSQLIEFLPRDVMLAPGTQQALQIQTTVPAGSAAGWYHGLLVVNGVNALRALIAIEVA